MLRQVLGNCFTQDGSEAEDLCAAVTDCIIPIPQPSVKTGKCEKNQKKLMAQILILTISFFISWTEPAA